MRSPLGALLNKTPVPYVSRASGLALPFRQPRGQEAQMRAMSSVGTLFAIADRNATSVAQAEWRLYRKAKSGRKEDRTEVTSHGALALWNRPNKFMTRQEFVEAQQQHYELTGEAWWVIARNQRSSLPLELWPVRPDRMEPVPHPTEYLTGYLYRGPGGEQVPLDPRDVIFLRRPDPLDPYRGVGPVQSLLSDLDATRYSAEWNRNFFLNSAEPGGIIEVPSHLSDPEWDDMLKRWDEQHKGVANAHRVAFVEHGKWVDRKFTQRDMQFAELRDVSREVIREAFGFPKPMLGTVEDVNRANAEAAEVVFARWLVVPRLERIKQALNSELLPLYGAEGLEFDYDNPVPEDREADARDLEVKAEAAKKLIEAGYEPESVRVALGLPEMAAAPAVGGDGMISPRELADMVQSIYLGVGTVLTWEEARGVCNRAGADLDLAVPAPEGLRPARSPHPRTAGTPEPEPAPAPAARLDIHHHATPALEQPRSLSVFDVARERRARPTATATDGDEDAEQLDQVREDHAAALEALLDDWQPIETAWIDALGDQIEQAINNSDPQALSTLTVGGEEAAGVLRGALAAAAQQAAQRIAEEAARQGVDVTVPEADETLTNRLRPPGITNYGGELVGIAAAVAALLGSYMAGAAAQEALRRYVPGAVGSTVANAVKDALRSLKGMFRRDQLGGALHRAVNVGRLATLEKAPRAVYRASERMDGSTCSRCRAIDGEVFEDLTEAWAAYGTGPYVECEGGIRCRGTIVAEWEPNRGSA